MRKLMLIVMLSVSLPVLASGYDGYRRSPPAPPPPPPTVIVNPSSPTATASSSSNDKLGRVLVNGAVVGLIWCGVCYSMDGCFKSRWCGPAEVKPESGSMVPAIPPNGFIDNRSRIETTTEVKGGR